MKFFVVGFALLAAACAVAELLPSTEYLPPGQELSGLEPILSDFSGGLVDDGYRYKTVRRLRLRHRRDVNELPSNDYLPPVQQQIAYPQVSLPQIQQQYASIPQIGAIQPSNEYLAPLGQSEPISEIASGVLADDGYRYKTVKRFRVRHRRDVNELPSNDYLPPVQQQIAYPQVSLPQIQQQYASIPQIGAIQPSNEYLAPLGQSEPISEIASGVLADDGYRYKTVKRFRVRHRRDVNELPSVDYLPPVQQQLGLSQLSSVQQLGLPSNEYLAPIGPSASIAQLSSGILADDGYRYKTVRRLRSRHRRDVNELPSVDYLPPVQQQLGLSQLSSVQQLGLPSNEYLAPIGPSAQIAQLSSGVLADDGYRYKTVKRFRSRHRREAPSVDYLPPVQQAAIQQLPIQQLPIQQLPIQQLPIQQLPIQQLSAIPSSQYLSPLDIAPVTSNLLSGVLADDGYRYKTVKKIKRRH